MASRGTRSGVSFSNPPMSARDLRMRSKAKKLLVALSVPKKKHQPQNVNGTHGSILVGSKPIPVAAITTSFASTAPTAPTPPAAPTATNVPIAPIIVSSVVVAQKKSKKKSKKSNQKTIMSKKKEKKRTIVKRFPFGIEMVLVNSFNDFFGECCTIDAANLSPKAPGILKVGDVQKEYKAWCLANDREYCPERTSKRWAIAPFKVNENSKETLPPFRLLMFQKLGRLPVRSKVLFDPMETSWRRHKKSYNGFPYYQGLAWKNGFTPTQKYKRTKKN